jgi:hypothetical protein
MVKEPKDKFLKYKRKIKYKRLRQLVLFYQLFGYKKEVNFEKY